MKQNREIKFRAWDGKSMLSDFIIYKTGDASMESGAWINKGLIELEWDSPNWVVMQYTGLKDKVGKEIWDGDIVEWENHQFIKETHFSGIRIKSLGKPKEDFPDWGAFLMRDEVSLSFRLWLKNERFGYEGEDLVSPEDCIVIGNKFENSELLSHETK